MSWQSEITTIVRHLINDTDLDSPTYSNSRIETSILVGSHLALLEIDFEQTYSINVDTCMLSPDPTTSGARDEAFINIVAMKTACIILGSELKAHALTSVRVSDGPSSIDTGQVSKNLQFLYEHICKQYEDYKFNFVVANNNVGKAVLSPYSPGLGNR